MSVLTHPFVRGALVLASWELAAGASCAAAWAAVSVPVRAWKRGRGER